MPRAKLNGFVVLGCSIGALVGASFVLAHPDDVPHGEGLEPYVGPGYVDGLPANAGTQFPSSGMVLRSWVTLGDMDPSAMTGNDCWGYTAGNRKYAIMGHSTGTAFVNITNPDSPVVVANHSGPTSAWRDVKTYGTFAYSVSEGGGGIQVFNLSLINNGLVPAPSSVTTGGTADTHNVAIDEVSGFLYRCGGAPDTGLRIYDLSNPGAPAFVAQWNDRYVHDAQVVTYTSGPYAGRQIAFCCTGLNNGEIDTGIDIVDVTDKQNIQVLANLSYPDDRYSHQGWLSPDRRYFYLGDELDEGDTVVNTRTIIFDVQDIDNPFVVGDFVNGSTSIGHNLYTMGPWIFEANYQSGVRVFDATSPLAPVETAFFDTFPAGDSPDFAGLWSVYPYFDDGTVIGSDLQRGLFVWTFADMFLRFEFPSGVPGTIAPGGATVPVRITETAGALAAGSAMLHYDTGAGFVSVPMTDNGNGDFSASFPALACGDPVEFYFSAETTDGVTVASPAGAPDRPGSLLTAEIGSATVAFEDTMDSDTGWNVGAPGDDATTGIWERVDPIPTGAQPDDDATPGAGGLCWITGNGTPGGSDGENDVDGGVTTLTSPLLDATAASGDAAIEYSRWLSNNQGSNPDTDTMEVSISNDNGGSWVLVESVNESLGTWVERLFPVADFVVPTSQMRVRFVVGDLGGGSIVEAGVDDLRVVFRDCVDTVAGDLDGDGDVDVDDLNAVLGAWLASVAPGTGSDLSGDGVVDVDDLNIVLGNWGMTAP